MAQIPFIVNSSLESDPITSGLINTNKFKPIISSKTPSSSLIFPSLKASCLIADLTSVVGQKEKFQKLLESGLQFIQSNTKPFILLKPSSAEEPTESLSVANNLLFELSKVSKKTPVVTVAWSEVMAVKTIMFMLSKVEKGREGRQEDPEEQLSEVMVTARVLAALNKTGMLGESEAGRELLEETSFLGNLPSTYTRLPQQLQSYLEEDRSY